MARMFYCKESPELKLGDDSAPPVVFHQGFATVADDDENRATKLGWLAAEHNFLIEDLGDDPDQVADGEQCPICERSFSTPFALKGHLRSHQPKA